MRRSLWTAWASTILSAAALAGAEEPVATGGVSLQAVATDAGIIHASEAGAKRPLVVDACGSLRLLIAGSKPIDVALETPDGSFLTKESGAPVVGWHVLEGDVTLVELEAPRPGRYVVHVSRPGTEDVVFTIASLSDSALRMGLWVASPSVLENAPFVIATLLQDDGQAVREAQVTAVLSRVESAGVPGVVVGEATLRDDGRDADAQAGDGIYTAVVSAGPEGTTWANVRARGIAASGDAFERTGALQIEASKATVAVDPAGEPKWRWNGDRIEALLLELSASGDDGEYDLTLTVRASNGRSVTGGEVLRVEGGSGTAKVAVPSALVKTLAVDGPYFVESVAVHGRTDGPRVLRGSRVLALKTSEIRLADLE